MAVTGRQLVLFAVAVVVLTVVITFVFRPLLFASVNPAVAEAKGRSGAPAVGHLMALLRAGGHHGRCRPSGRCCCSPLLVAPAATAIADRPAHRRHGGLDGVGAGRGVAGLALSAMFNMPPSFLIVTIVSVVWFRGGWPPSVSAAGRPNRAGRSR